MSKIITLTDEQFIFLVEELKGLQEYYWADGNVKWADKIENIIDCIEVSSQEK